mgnify:CR=1 FL=1
MNVDLGMLTFINHGCKGTFNLGIESEWHKLNTDKDGEIPEDYQLYGVAPYNSHRDCNLRLFGIEPFHNNQTRDAVPPNDGPVVERFLFLFPDYCTADD